MHGTSVIGGIVRGTHLCESLPIGQLDATLVLAHYNQEGAKEKADFPSCSNLTHEKHAFLQVLLPALSQPDFYRNGPCWLASQPHACPHVDLASAGYSQPPTESFSLSSLISLVDAESPTLSYPLPSLLHSVGPLPARVLVPRALS